MNSLFSLPKATVSSLRRPVVYTAAFIAAMNIMTSAQAAIFTAGFETSEGYDNSAPANVAGQKGWTINDATDQLSFFQFLGSGTNNVAALGGNYGEPLVNRVVLEHGVNTSLNNTRVNLSLLFVASTDYPGRDSFSVIFDNDNDPDNVPLFSIAFEPDPDPVRTEQLNMVWYDALNTRTSSLNAAQYGGLFDLSVEFDASGADMLFSARLEDLKGGGVNFNGTLAGASTASLTNLGVGFTLDPTAQNFGDNYIAFDDVVVSKGGVQSVPETGVGLAWLAVLGVLGMGRVFVSGRSRTA